MFLSLLKVILTMYLTSTFTSCSLPSCRFFSLPLLLQYLKHVLNILSPLLYPLTLFFFLLVCSSSSGIEKVKKCFSPSKALWELVLQMWNSNTFLEKNPKLLKTFLCWSFHRLELSCGPKVIQDCVAKIMSKSKSTFFHFLYWKEHSQKLRICLNKICWIIWKY